MPRWAIVLAGGSGTRFWPLSTPNTPKQFLPLAGDRSLLRETVDRFDGLVTAERTIVVTGERHAARTRELLSDIPSENVLAEPTAASTGPALTWASHHVRARDPDASILSVHSDAHIDDAHAFRRDASKALTVAEEYDVLATIGIVPTRPDIGYGYIVPGTPLSETAANVDRFVEKPTAEVAASLIAEGGLWNCGLFAWTATRFFKETEEHATEIAPQLPLLDRGNVGSFFRDVKPVAIDVSHFERSKRVAVIPASFKWDDVGTWAALSRVRPTDAHGNVNVGEVKSVDCDDCIVWAPNERVALYGVNGLVVTRVNGVTLVTTREAAVKLKEFVETLPENWREP